MMNKQPHYLSAKEAADQLGISVASLYSYVSRGLLGSEPGADSSRARRYRVEEVEALAARKEYRHEPAKAAETALSFGMPVLESAITLIENGKLYYRGHDALTLAQERSFEEVAALLWTGELATGELFATNAAPAESWPHAGDPANLIELYQAALAWAAPHDLAAHQLTSAAVARTGARIVSLLTRATIGGPPGGGSSQSPRLPIANALQQAWAPAQPDTAPLLSAALILCADHELNVSAFTARCVASAGSAPYAVVIAALAALQGYRHGGCTAQTAALLAAAGSSGARATVAGYLRGGDKLPGFGHPLYPAGDPRARGLLALLNRRLPDAPGMQVANELCEAVSAALGQYPTIDLALAALAAALGAPSHSPLALFALGRTAGWLAHASEQYALDQLIRPRARYSGPQPL
jgi:citrate synthase